MKQPIFMLGRNFNEAEKIFNEQFLNNPFQKTGNRDKAKRKSMFHFCGLLDYRISFPLIFYFGVMLNRYHSVNQNWLTN